MAGPDRKPSPGPITAVDAAGLERFFTDLTAESFAELSIREPRVVRYVAGVLARFHRAERLLRFRDPSGEPIETLVELLVAEREGTAVDTVRAHRGRRAIAERDFRRHVGDFALFTSGLFRDFASARGILGYYLEEGRRSYWRVAITSSEAARPDPGLFAELARDFELYADAIHFMKKTRFQGDAPAPLWWLARAIARRQGPDDAVH